MKSLSLFSIGVFLALAACRLDPTLAARYPGWMYALFISSQLLVYAASNFKRGNRQDSK